MKLRSLALVLFAVVPALGQIPDTFQNLQVFPKDIKKPQLIEAMKRFSSATGLRCEGCHVGKGGPALEAMEWASDAKEEKKTARVMLKMTKAINDEYISKLGRAKEVRVSCATCHHGVPKPGLLDEIVVRTAREKGIDAAIASYRELRTKHYGSGAYDFSEKTLNVAAQELLGEGKGKEAAALLDVSVEYGAKEARTYALLSDARLAAGDKPGALAAIKKAVELDPSAEWAKKKLEKLEKAEKAE